MSASGHRTSRIPAGRERAATRRRRLTLVGATAVVAASLAGCGSALPVKASTRPSTPVTVPATTAPPPATAAPPTSTPSPPTTTQPDPAPLTLPRVAHARPGRTLLRTVLADAAAKHWLHTSTTSQSRTNSATLTTTTVDGPDRGTQDLVVGPVAGHIRVLRSRTYIEGTPEGLVLLFGVPTSIARRYGGRWVILAPSDSNYRTVTSGVTLPSILSELALTGRVTEGKVRLAGRAVTVIEGEAPGSGGRGSGALYVTGGAKPLPLVYEEVGPGGTSRTTFADWGRAATVAAPRGAVLLPVPPRIAAPAGVVRPG